MVAPKIALISSLLFIVSLKLGFIKAHNGLSYSKLDRTILISNNEIQKAIIGIKQSLFLAAFILLPIGYTLKLTEDSMVPLLLYVYMILYVKLKSYGHYGGYCFGILLSCLFHRILIQNLSLT